ncbi:hypothetical protein BLJ79_12665 [Arthrobacter sp. UCD-GKA]|uniref:hypothetical protein n=1 Tax=Arthrobacter sp. UCD-GKA TaxID=1913576 RepID=UPI0008DE6F43|nr:hypothetical protein [Arthrobacter sp. UCD-GKA]OIH84305.1 hypothetical protein BLJ79_12665 [Arthrobacter sp. UCD-GKA]
MKKLFWVGIGIGVGVLAARKLSEARGLASADGLNRTVGRISDSLHEVAEAFRTGMNERETELRQALGLDETTGASHH